MESNIQQDHTAADELRRRAEDRLTMHPAETRSFLTEDERQKFHHELQVHRLELEMQNAELRRTRDELEKALGDCTERLMTESDTSGATCRVASKDGEVRK